MTFFAPVAPISLLHKLDERQTAGPYHLLLAHDVVEKKTQYQRLFQKKSTQWQVIMDNSAVELGEPVSPDVLLEAVTICHATVVVLPDHLLDPKATVKSTTEALKEWEEPLRNYPRTLDLMVVPQGKSVGQWTVCALALSKLHSPRIKWWGIPRNFRDKCGESRQTAVCLAHSFRPDWNIHLLGFSEDTIDDILVAKDPRVHGIDSAVPVRIGQANELFIPGMETPPRGEWWESANAETEVTEECVQNIYDVREWIRTWRS